MTLKYEEKLSKKDEEMTQLKSALTTLQVKWFVIFLEMSNQYQSASVWKIIIIIISEIINKKSVTRISFLT